MFPHPSRRALLQTTAAASASLPFWESIARAIDGPDKPNFVFLVADDMSCDMGCYGDKTAHTPNLDRLASEGCRYDNAFTHCPVCAPSRSGLITGQYPTTIGTQHMRSMLLKAPPMVTEYLRKAGYFVDWPGKTDFNFAAPKDAFDSTAEWINAPQPPKQPFLAYHNLFMTHESQIRHFQNSFVRNTRRLKTEDRQDRAKVPIPPYYPDTPEVREDIASYYELVTALDYAAGDIIKKLDQWKVAENTVVFFFGDHGWGMPRGKRWLYDSGIKVPLIVRWPGDIKAGSTSDELVSFIDFAPTLLKLAGAPIPASMQGQAFLGDNVTPRKYIFAHRDRMDETFDRVRAVRDNRWKYIRNFHPELTYALRNEYMELMPTMQVWRKLHAEGKLNATQDHFFSPTKPKEELYDTQADPYEIHNLADSPDPIHQAKLKELRLALDQWIEQTHDLGEISEREMIQRGLVKDVLEQYEKRKIERK
jgi:N-sulfoglucosamine sulfohydrolase